MKETKRGSIKCVVWDLDHTIWDGVLSEGDELVLKEGVIEIIRTLDERGILQSIASKNEYDTAYEALKKFNIEEYFLYPQINWGAKSSSVKTIAGLINISMETIAFIDDQAFERGEMSFALPEVLVIDAADLADVLCMPEMNPRFITEDSKIRRKMYISDIKRNEIEKHFEGAQEEFLASLGMRITIKPVGEDDLKRAEELTVRTHQLNTTGYTYDYDELDNFRKLDQYKLLIVGLTDIYGTYGKIGLVLIECQEELWNIKLLLMSCRVMSRGIGTVLINYILSLAKESHIGVQAEYIQTDRNRMMYITYKLAGFKEFTDSEGITILRNDLKNIQKIPDYIDLVIE